MVQRLLNQQILNLSEWERYDRLHELVVLFGPAN